MREAINQLSVNFPEAYWREHDEKAEFPQEYFDALAKGGWFQLNVPARSGGTGLALTDVSVVIHEASRSMGMSAGDLIMAICVFGIQTIKTFASASIKDRILRELGSGEHIVSFCLTEPGAGVNSTDIVTSGTREGDGFVLNGHKIWSTLLHKSSLVILATRTTPKENVTKKTNGITLFLIEKGKLKRGEIRTKRIDDISMRCLGSNEAFFEDVYVPFENVLGKVDEGWNVLSTLLNAERISTASMSVGLGELVLGKAVNYARTRHVFERPIGTNQGIQFPLADSKVELETCWAITKKAAWQFDHSVDSAVSANVAAYLGAKAAFLASDRAIQTYGGMAFAKSSDIERHWRDSRLFRVGPVPQEMALSFLGQHALGLPRSF